MSLWRHGWAGVVAVAMALSDPTPAGASPGGPPPPPAAEGEASGFDDVRKPPTPVSFSSDDEGWIEFRYPPAARDRVARLVAEAEEARGDLAEALGQPPLEDVEVRVAIHGAEEMATLAPLGLPPPSGATGVTYTKLKLIVLSFGAFGASSPGELRETFRRELAHLALSEALGGRDASRWFTEGFAIHFSGESPWAREWLLLKGSMRHTLLPLADLDVRLATADAAGALAAAEGSDFVGHLLEPERHGRFAACTAKLREGEPLPAALASAYGASVQDLERAWRSALARQSTLTTVLLSVGVPVLLMVSLIAIRAWRRRRAGAPPVSVKGKKPRGGGASPAVPRVHIVFSRRDERADMAVLPEADVPKVEHEGEWHTLH
jgi:hypothetical protein